ncbi:hypothetical protein [Mesorhizobium sp. M0965]
MWEKMRVNMVCRNEDTPMLRTGFAVRELDPNTAMADVTTWCRLVASRG